MKNKIERYWLLYGRDVVCGLFGFAAGLFATWVF